VLVKLTPGSKKIKRCFDYEKRIDVVILKQLNAKGNRVYAQYDEYLKYLRSRGFINPSSKYGVGSCTKKWLEIRRFFFQKNSNQSGNPANKQILI
jgi:hypothetical protein